jgi:hypothetical protein
MKSHKQGKLNPCPQKKAIKSGDSSLVSLTDFARIWSPSSAFSHLKSILFSTFNCDGKKVDLI